MRLPKKKAARTRTAARKPQPKPKPFARQLQRIRKICLALAGASERLSHNEPTFFVANGVFAMFANNHHGDGRVAVWLPAPEGFQEIAIASDPAAYFRPPYVGPYGWIGAELDRVSEAVLTGHIHKAWELITSKKKKKATKRPGREIKS